MIQLEESMQFYYDTKSYCLEIILPKSVTVGVNNKETGKGIKKL
jgi:hypothetical protein